MINSQATKKLEKSGKNRIIEIYFFMVLQAVILFVSAGRLDLPRIWIYFGITAVYQTIVLIIMIKVFPETIEIINERGKKHKGTKPFDIVFGIFYLIPLVATPVVAGLDAGRFGWSHISINFFIPGLILYILGGLLINWAMFVNKYFEKTVRIQDDRDQQVISTGPYGILRHPGYVAIIIMNLAFPLVVGSAYTFIPAGISTILLIIRTALEDRTLRNELKGYVEYTKKVRFRLIPGVW